jgi:hypothetical protein
LIKILEFKIRCYSFTETLPTAPIIIGRKKNTARSYSVSVSSQTELHSIFDGAGTPDNRVGRSDKRVYLKQKENLKIKKQRILIKLSCRVRCSWNVNQLYYTSLSCPFITRIKNASQFFVIIIVLSLWFDRENRFFTHIYKNMNMQCPMSREKNN